MRPKRVFVFLGFVFLCLGLAFPQPFSGATKQLSPSEFSVHEWGTFTSISASDGAAMLWLPLSAPDDLPSFVERFRGTNFKAGLAGTVRMETPVMYFYTPRKMTVSVKVAFSKGLITEWYPHASQVEPASQMDVLSFGSKNFREGSIAWDSVTLDPQSKAAFPRESAESRYYAARATSSTPLRVAAATGDENEKFLFYRGVSTFPIPISAVQTPQGNLSVKNLDGQEIPNVILFERRGEKLGYRMGGAVNGELLLDPPRLTGSVDSLEGDLRAMLVRQGLYADEARAMVRTWHDSWFEEGSRLMYIVPSSFVDSILPLDVDPTPAKTVRVFVGRIELMTPATEKAVETALESSDDATLAKYGRFLDAIVAEMIRHSDMAQANVLRELDGAYHNRLNRRSLTGVR